MLCSCHACTSTTRGVCRDVTHVATCQARCRCQQAAENVQEGAESSEGQIVPREDSDTGTAVIIADETQGNENNISTPALCTCTTTNDLQLL
ncbi:hypothetical protein PoB_002151700 [Plakobranchus ocellatus]|uniref:Uncharacterized protein n=1 Tax=Plakobranchus ocellatus TaxID=259542 RepID=A0AAV3ZI68_9GAST|nr:hypothetical protein PoB_002151700 [Plakobranchus ocellatus]